MTQPDHDLILPEASRRKFDRLMLVARKIRAGSMKGERRSVKRGTSIEFADYRNYTPGDDLRKLDWNVYARLEKPYVKLLEDEEDLAVHILLDNSASMRFAVETDDERDKFLFAQRIAASLAYISLSSNDRLMMSTLSDAGPNNFGPARGRSHIVPMLKYAHQVKAKGVTNLNFALKQYALRERRAGLLFIISDLLTADGFTEGLNALIGRGHEIVIIHTLTPEEVRPSLTGDLRLIDVETNLAQEVTVDATMISIYERRVQDWLSGIHAETTRKGVHYALAQTDSAPEKLLLYDLRRAGIVK